MLDCHDGVPVKPDLDGLYDGAEVRRVVETCVARGGNLSLIVSPEHQDRDGFDVHQIRGTYYSLLDRDDDAYIAARAIQLFAPGIPQIYYVGLLAGENDQEAAERTGDGREVNRHNFSREEIRVAKASKRRPAPRTADPAAQLACRVRRRLQSRSRPTAGSACRGRPEPRPARSTSTSAPCARAWN